MTEEVKTNEPTFNLSAVFNKSGKPSESDSQDKTEAESKKVDPSAEDKKKQVPAKAEEVKVSKQEEPKAKKQDVEGEDDDDLDADDEELKTDSKVPAQNEELEKLKKTLKDTQRAFHEDRRKLAGYKRAVEKLKDDLVLSEDEAKLLLDHTQVDDDFADEPIEEPSFQKYLRVWDREVENMCKYSEMLGINKSVIQDHVDAFKNLFVSVDDFERENILLELSAYEDNDAALTKAMLDMGRQYDEDIFKHIRQAGSIRNLIANFEKEKQELQNKLDNARNKIDKLKERRQEDYNEEPYRGRTSSNGSNIDTKATKNFDMKALFRK